MPNEYYRSKHIKRTADLKPATYICLPLLLVLILGILGQCCFKDERRPIIHARPPTIEQKVSMMDEVYTAAVERNYREGNW